MRKAILSQLCVGLVILVLAGCAESRQDPCRLLTVEDASAVDDTVAVAVWAGRDGERKEDEVCVFHDADGEARLMLFVWYDPATDPETLVSEGADMLGGELVEFPDIGSGAFATFQDKELKLLAVRSPLGVVGLRVRKPVRKNSRELNELARLAEKALSNNL